MIKFFKSPQFDQLCGLVMLFCSLFLKDTSLAIVGAAFYLGGVIEGRGTRK